MARIEVQIDSHLKKVVTDQGTHDSGKSMSQKDAFLRAGLCRYRPIVMVSSCLLVIMAVFHLHVIEVFGDEKPSPEQVPEKTSPYTVTFQNTAFKGSINTTVAVLLEIRPNPAPSGRFYSILADILQKPLGAKVEIKSGYKQIEMIGDRKGLYRLLVKINVLQKSSCGGIDAEEIRIQEISVHLD